jgi:hypothetical protein
LTHPTGHFWVKKICKNLDISYRHIYLGHPLKLKGVWAYFILDDFIIVTPTGTLFHDEMYGTTGIGAYDLVISERVLA